MPNPKFRRIRAVELSPGEKVLVRGNVAYSRIASHIDGEELARDMERRRRAGRPVIEKPYVTLSLSDARIVPKDPKTAHGLADMAGGMTLEEAYVEQNFYRSMKSTRPGMNFTAISRSQSLPWLGELVPPNVIHKDGPAKHELKPGTDVTAVMIIFQSRFGNGVGLDGVIVNVPGECRDPDETDLSEYGLVFA